MNYVKHKYSQARGYILAKDGCKRFFKFASLPELKVCKTIGFILSVLF